MAIQLGQVKFAWRHIFKNFKIEEFLLKSHHSAKSLDSNRVCEWTFRWEVSVNLSMAIAIRKDRNFSIEIASLIVCERWRKCIEMAVINCLGSFGGARRGRATHIDFLSEATAGSSLEIWAQVKSPMEPREVQSLFLTLTFSLTKLTSVSFQTAFSNWSVSNLVNSGML